MDWKGIAVGITGATGFVGRHLCHRLIAAGAEVTAFIRDDLLEPHERLRIVRGDLQNYESVWRLFYEQPLDMVFHLGAMAPVHQGRLAPLSAILTNVLGTAHVLHASASADCVPLIISSSDKAYGHPSTVPVTEIMPPNPYHPYDASKAAADLIALPYARMYGVPMHILRCANIYGPGDTEWSRLIPGCIKAFLLNKTFIVRSDGTPKRNYLYIEDAINAFMVAGASLISEGSREELIWNVSHGSGRPVREVIDVLRGAIGKGEVEYKTEELGETNDLTVDDTAFRETFKWKSKTQFIRGISFTVGWIADYFGLP